VALYVLAIAAGGYFFGREALEDLIREREVGIELLMAVAAVVAAVMGQPGEGAMLVFLYSISEAVEGYTADKTRSAIRALMKLAPRTALVHRDGGEVEIPVEELARGDVFLVRPGQSVATDGVVETGTTALNEAPVTGESMPVEKGPGDQVLAGTINGQGALEVRATRTFADNTLSRIIRMVEEAQERKGKSQRFVERFGRRYSPAVLAVGALVALGPPLVAAESWTEWIMRATVFIVAAAPCALAISIPITLVAALGTAARKGVLIKGGVHLEELARIRVVALDKTGTLTRGEPELTDVVVLDSAPEEHRSETALLAAAAGIERWSEHPLARAIVRGAEQRGASAAIATRFRSHTAAGAEALVQGRRVLVGSPTLFRDDLEALTSEVDGQVQRLQEEGKTVVLVGEHGSAWAVLALRDNLRDDARPAIEALRSLGVEHIIMLTGDNHRTARAIAREAGIDEVRAELKPEDKAASIRELQARHGHVLMVGDGVNDAPALAEAAVGVAMGAAGTDVALETADVALMADDLGKLVYALGLARRNAGIVRQNLVLSAVVITVLVAGAVAGAFTLPIAVIGHELSEFVVIANGLRMLRGQEGTMVRNPRRSR
jgi:Cd2+/Zn2+-exporting ATPase